MMGKIFSASMTELNLSRLIDINVNHIFIYVYLKLTKIFSKLDY